MVVEKEVGQAVPFFYLFLSDAPLSSSSWKRNLVLERNRAKHSSVLSQKKVSSLLRSCHLEEIPNLPRESPDRIPATSKRKEDGASGVQS